MAKSANVYARIEPEIKEQAEMILNALGIPASNAITMFYKQIILQKGLPFDVKLPEHPLDVSLMTPEQLNMELDMRIYRKGIRFRLRRFLRKSKGESYDEHRNYPGLQT